MNSPTILTIKYVASFFLGSLSAALGGCDDLFLLFSTLVAVDFFFGILKSLKEKNFSSSIARWGFANKCMEFAMIAICCRLDLLINGGVLLRNMSLVWFSICEGASILETSCILGLPLPEGLSTVLLQTKKSFSINFLDIIKKSIQESENKKEKDKES